MRAFLIAATVLVALCWAGVSTPAGHAQDVEPVELAEPAPVLADPALENPAEPEVRFDVETGERYALGRPEDPARQGRLEASPWMVYLAGGITAMFAMIVLVRRSRPKRS